MYRIVDIHEEDAYYNNRKELVGKIGEFEESEETTTYVPEGFVAGNFYDGCEEDSTVCFFYAVKLEEVK